MASFKPWPLLKASATDTLPDAYRPRPLACGGVPVAPQRPPAGSAADHGDSRAVPVAARGAAGLPPVRTTRSWHSESSGIE